MHSSRPSLLLALSEGQALEAPSMGEVAELGGRVSDLLGIIDPYVAGRESYLLTDR
jgi:hypothetical protein